MLNPEGPPPHSNPEDEPVGSSAEDSPAPADEAEAAEVWSGSEEINEEVAEEVGELAVEETVHIDEEPVPIPEPGIHTETDDDAADTTRPSPGDKYAAQGIRIVRPVNGKIGRGGRRHFGGYEHEGGGTYKFVYDTERISDRIGVPKEVIEAAAEKGISPEQLVRAKKNEHVAEHIRNQGIAWGKEMPPEPPMAGRSVSAAELESIKEDHGIEVAMDYIDFARGEAERRNLRPADYLASLGLDLGLGRLNPPDPTIKTSEIGLRRRAGVREVIKNIENDPSKVRRSLKRPGKLPLLLHKLPLVGQPLGKRVLALRTALKAKKDMPFELNQMEKKLEELQNLGVRNEIDQWEMEDLPERINEKRIQIEDTRKSGNSWLLKKYRRYHDYLDNLDASILSHRKRLHPLQRSEFHGEAGATERRNLAYRVFDARISLEALKDLKIIDMDNPEFVHNHEKFKKDRRAFRASVKQSPEDIV